MAVGGAPEAPGAGSANVVVADNTPPANAAPDNPSPASPTGRGSAGYLQIYLRCSFSFSS